MTCPAPTRPIAAAALATVFCLCACSSDPSIGYAFAPAHDSTVSSVAVPVFRNQTFDRGVGAELTEAIVKEIQRRTDWVVTNAGDADRILAGTVTRSEQRLLAIDRETGLGQQLAVVLTIDFNFTNRKNEVLLARTGYTASASYVPTFVVGERREVGRHAAVQNLAKSIVDELRNAW